MSTKTSKIITKSDVLAFFANSSCSNCAFSKECDKLESVSRGYTTNSTNLCQVIRGGWE